MLDPERRALTRALSAHVGRIAGELRPQLLASDDAQALHVQEQVGDPFELGPNARACLTFQ